MKTPSFLPNANRKLLFALCFTIMYSAINFRVSAQTNVEWINLNNMQGDPSGQLTVYNDGHHPSGLWQYGTAASADVIAAIDTGSFTFTVRGSMSDSAWYGLAVTNFIEPGGNGYNCLLASYTDEFPAFVFYAKVYSGTAYIYNSVSSTTTPVGSFSVGLGDKVTIQKAFVSYPSDSLDYHVNFLKNGASTGVTITYCELCLGFDWALGLNFGVVAKQYGDTIGPVQCTVGHDIYGMGSKDYSVTWDAAKFLNADTDNSFSSYIGNLPLFTKAVSSGADGGYGYGVSSNILKDRDNGYVQTQWLTTGDVDASFGLASYDDSAANLNFFRITDGDIYVSASDGHYQNYGAIHMGDILEIERYNGIFGFVKNANVLYVNSTSMFATDSTSYPSSSYDMHAVFGLDYGDHLFNLSASFATGLIAVASSNSPVCESGELDLKANATEGGSYTWSWSGPNSFTSSLQNPVINHPTSAAAGTYTVQVTGVGDTITATTSVTITSCSQPCIDSVSVGNPNELIINTGWDYNTQTNSYPIGSSDPSWYVIQTPGGNSVCSPATVVTYVAWSTFAHSNWVSFGPGAVGWYDYAFIFDLPINYNNVTLSMGLLADNAAAVFLNGRELIPTTPSYPNGPFTHQDFTDTTATLIFEDSCYKFHPGCDTLIVRVYNASSVTGFDVKGSITINECSTCDSCSPCAYLTPPPIYTTGSCFTTNPGPQLALVSPIPGYSYAWTILTVSGPGAILSTSIGPTTYWLALGDGVFQICVTVTDDETGCQIATCENIQIGGSCRLANPYALNATSVSSKLYPNPSNGMLTLEYQLSTNAGLLEVFNVVGEMVYSHSLDGDMNKFEFDIADLCCGMFEYRIFDGNNVVAHDRLVLIK